MPDGNDAQIRIPSGATLVGECLDTHNPHVPLRVLVRTRDEAGHEVCAWLPTLAELRVRPGQRVLLSKPDNWAEAIVVGVIAGLGSTDAREPRAPTTDAGATAPAGRPLTLVGHDGAPLLELQPTGEGLRLRLLTDQVELDGGACLRLGAERIELRAGAGGIDLRTDGEAVVRGRVIRLN